MPAAVPTPVYRGGQPVCPSSVWAAHASAENAVATATYAADADATLQHFITSIVAGYGTLGVAGTLSVTGLHADAVVFPVNGWLVYTPCVPIPASAINTAVAAALTAGGSSKTGYVVITGFTAKP